MRLAPAQGPEQATHLRCCWSSGQGGRSLRAGGRVGGLGPRVMAGSFRVPMGHLASWPCNCHPVTLTLSLETLVQART